METSHGRYVYVQKGEREEQVRCDGDISSAEERLDLDENSRRFQVLFVDGGAHQIRLKTGSI